MKNSLKLNASLSEVYGALIGDGCLSKYSRKDRPSKQKIVLYTGHLKNDTPYYKNTIKPIFIKKFNTTGYLYERKKYNCVRYITYNKEAFNFFLDLGFPVGKKRNLKIPKEICSNNKYALACTRGIFDTDGTIYRRYSKKYKNHKQKYNHLVIQIKLNSKEVIEQIKDILERNKINTTKIGRYKNSFVLRITNQKHIHNFFKIIKPSNKYHLLRYKHLPQTS